LPKCVFQSKDVACDFCLQVEGNISTPCKKILGPKTEAKLSRTISTTSDETFPSSYVSLLQYAYSERYEGLRIAATIKKLAFLFHFWSNQRAPTHEDGLKFASVFLHSQVSASITPEGFSWRTYQDLVAKNHTAFLEADIFAARLLLVIYGFSGSQKILEAYRRFFDTIIHALVNKTKSPVTFPLSRIFRDINMESNHGLQSNDQILQFCQKSREAIESEYDFTQRANEFMESHEAAFSDCLWQSCRLLRKCFRFVLSKECEGRTERSERVQSALIDMKTYLESKEVRRVIDGIAARKIAEQIEQKTDADFNSPTLTLLIYRFCQLLMVLLSRSTVLEATSALDTIAAGTYLLEFIRNEFVPLSIPAPDYIESRNANSILPRILCMAGLQFPKSTYPERKYQPVLCSDVFSFYLDYYPDYSPR